MHNKFQANFLWKICKNKKKINSRLVLTSLVKMCVWKESLVARRNCIDIFYFISTFYSTVLWDWVGLDWIFEACSHHFLKSNSSSFFMIYWGESYLKHIIIYWMVSFQGSSQLILQKYEYCS